MAQEKETEPKKTRRPSALKRDLQHEKRRLNNRAFKARVNTAIRSLEASIAQKDTTAVQKNLNLVYSLMDKGVKTGKFKLNTVKRKKSRFAHYNPQTTLS